MTNTGEGLVLGEDLHLHSRTMVISAGSHGAGKDTNFSGVCFVKVLIYSQGRCPHDTFMLQGPHILSSCFGLRGRQCLFSNMACFIYLLETETPQAFFPGGVFIHSLSSYTLCLAALSCLLFSTANALDILYLTWLRDVWFLLH